jgi:hypothetical protein
MIPFAVLSLTGNHTTSFKESTIMAKLSKTHPGFKGAMKQVEKSGYSASSAAKIIGYNKAHASSAAKKANPRLNKTTKGK